MGVSPVNNSSFGLGGFTQPLSEEEQQAQQQYAQQYGSPYGQQNTGFFNPAAFAQQGQQVQQQAEPPKKSGGFFSKVGAVVRGVTDIPGKLIGGVVQTATSIVTDPIGTLTDPKKLALIGLTVAAFIPGVNAVAIPALAAYGIYEGGKMAVQGGVQAYQGWKTNDLDMIEDGVANAGTGAVIAGASVVGARANIKASVGSEAATRAGIEGAKGTGFIQSQKLAYQNGKLLFQEGRMAFRGPASGTSAVSGTSQLPGVGRIRITEGGVAGLRQYGSQLYNGSPLQRGVQGATSRVQQARSGGVEGAQGAAQSARGTVRNLQEQAAGRINLNRSTPQQLLDRLDEISTSTRTSVPGSPITQEFYAIQSELGRRGATFQSNGAIDISSASRQGFTSSAREAANGAADWLSRNDIFHFGQGRVAAGATPAGGLPGLPGRINNINPRLGSTSGNLNGFNAFNVGANGIPVVAASAAGQVDPFQQIQEHMLAQYRAMGYNV